MRRTPRVLAVCVAGFLLALGSVGDTRAGNSAERCCLEPVNGDCKARITKVRFDQDRNKCVEYIYDGCGPVVPFDDIEECQALCEAGEGIRLDEIRRIDDRPYAVVEVEYPKSWPDEPAFSVSVNGQPADMRWAGGGYSGETQNASFQVFTGAKPVREVRVTSSVDGKQYEAKVDLNWSFPAIALLLDRPGNRDALFEDAELRFFLFKAQDLSILHNGKALVTEPLDGIVRHGEVSRVKPPWQDGLNIITLVATAADGSRIDHEYSFVFLGNGRMAKGETANVIFGFPGSRSGPFFRVGMAGDAVTMEPEALSVINGAKIDTPDSQGWLLDGQVLRRSIAGSAPGDATVLFFEKPHFRMPETLVREFRIRVTDRGPAEGGEQR